MSKGPKVDMASQAQGIDKRYYNTVFIARKDRKFMCGNIHSTTQLRSGTSISHLGFINMILTMRGLAFEFEMAGKLLGMAFTSRLWPAFKVIANIISNYPLHKGSRAAVYSSRAVKCSLMK